MANDTVGHAGVDADLDPRFRYPQPAKDRGPFFWLHPGNLLASRRKGRADHSNEWRESFHAEYAIPPAHAKGIEELVPSVSDGYRIVVLGDSGEGDRSQYGLLPLIRALRPDMMIINGDVAYPAGRVDPSGDRDQDDFLAGFFEPYANLRIPIWATAGNHEYYSDNHGKEFFETFCTQAWAKRWSDAGLTLIPQPGMYWELSDDAASFAILALDSGMAGDLDGVTQDRPDTEQHAWLTARLARAEADGIKVIVLFHIPGLVNGQHAKETHLDRLHTLLGSFSCVKVVVCAHEHSLQRYDASEFDRYIRRDQKDDPPGAASAPGQAPEYMVAGSSGAALSPTTWFEKDGQPQTMAFPCRLVLPAKWEEFASGMMKLIADFNLHNSFLGHLVGVFFSDGLSDADAPDGLSLLTIDVRGRQPGGTPSIVVTPYFQDDFSTLYASQPGVTVDVQAANPRPDPAAVDGFRRDDMKVVL